MPLARIYTWSVEEAEPLSADLFGRGYTVEVVVPDAELSSPADLELRLEHCSLAQAVARVADGNGSPARCVFLAPATSPRQDLILIEMTVAATATGSRHPHQVPVNLPAASQVDPAALAPRLEEMKPTQVIVLPLPAKETLAVASLRDVRVPSIDTKSAHDDDWSKVVSTEVTAFLAHAPGLEPERFFPVEILSGLRHSRIAERVRNRWEVLTVLGVASSIVMLLCIHWMAGPSRPVAAAARLPVGAVHASPLRLASTTQRTPMTRPGDLIARDTVVRLGEPTRKAPRLQPTLAAGKLSISRTAAGSMNPAQTRPTTIKRITDF